MDPSATLSARLLRVWELRYFWGSLVHADVSNRYRRTTLGMGWSLLKPLCMTAVFCLVFANLFNMNAKEYASFVIIGMSFWSYFCESIIGGCESFHQGQAYIRQQPLPLAIFPLRTVLGAGVHAALSLLLAFALALLLNRQFNAVALLSLIPTLSLAFLLAWFAAIIAGLTNVHFPDVKHLMEVALQLLFYLTPVMYPPEILSGRSFGAYILNFNPLTHLLAMLREPVIHGTVPPLSSYLILIATTLFLGWIAAMCLRLLERRLVFWL